ncbi:MAG: hypothetical protein RLZZ219_724, partial [Cyanobacteriota bacterium]
MHPPTPAMTAPLWRLDASRLPQRLELDLSPQLHRALERLSASTGRSMRDLAEELICRGAS